MAYYAPVSNSHVTVTLFMFLSLHCVTMTSLFTKGALLQLSAFNFDRLTRVATVSLSQSGTGVWGEPPADGRPGVSPPENF